MDRFGLTPWDVCDVVYVIHAERTERQAVAVLTAGGGGSVQDALDEFDAELRKEPKQVSPQYAQLRQALGV